MDVLGCGERNAGFFGKFYNVLFYFLYFGNIRMLADFQKEISLAKDFLVFKSELFRFLIFSVKKGAVHFAGEAGGEGDEAFVGFAQKFFVRGRRIIKTFEMRLAYYFYKVFPADIIFREKYEMKITFVGVFGEPAFGSDICFNP